MARAVRNIFNKNTHPYCHSGYQYAIDVCSGAIVANIYIKAVCARMLEEIKNEDHEDWFFDKERAERYLRLVQKFKHVKGKWENPLIVYRPWQNFAWMCIQGFINRYTGFRRFRVVHLDVARGNAKSTQASQAILFDLALDNPNGNAIKTAATKTSQAELVLEDAMEMARKNKGFLTKTGVQVRASDIIHKESNSSAEALSSKAITNDGLNASLIVMDELHAMRRDFFDVISSGMIKRRDSLMLCITTAGVDSTSVGYEQNAYAKKHCLGEVTDDSFFALVYTLDAEDSIFDEKVWIKANPGLGDSVDLEQIRAKATKALEIPSELVNFRIKNMNLWTEDAKAFFSVEQWDACEDKSLTWEDFKGQPVMLAVDLAPRVDLSVRAYVMRKNGVYKIWTKSFIPEDTVKSRDGVDRFIGWAEEGHLITTPGAVIDFSEFRKGMLEECEQVKVLKMAYDPWNAIEFAQSVSNKIEAFVFKQSTQNYSEPMKKFDALLYDRKIAHNGNPLVRWCLSNVVAKEDANGNVFPRKDHVKLKIDPILAIIMAIALWIQEQEEESMYESSGFRSF